MKRTRVTMADIAAKVGVSRIAVSMALRNSHRISLTTRRKIQRAAKEMGFVPDPFLSALAAHRRQRLKANDHGALAWINHWSDPRRLRGFKEFDLYWRGAAEAASQHGYRLDEVRWGSDCSPKRLEKILLARGVDGVLVPPHRALIDWGDFDWSRFSVVRFGLSVPNPDSNLVTADGFRGVVMAVAKMHEYGYRRIGFTVNGEFNQRTGGNLLSGFYYVQSLLKLQPSVPPLLTFLTTRSSEELVLQKAALGNWIAEFKVDAVLTSDMEVPGMIRELGYRIPQDIAVAGTSILDIADVDAGMDQHPEAIGRTAVEMLLKQMNVNERGEPQSPSRILVESRWRDGGSLPPLRPQMTPWNPPTAAHPATARKQVTVRRVTQQDIADEVGVTKNTVSMALRESPRIRPAVRENIRRVANELGYVADPILQRLAAYRRTGQLKQHQSVIAWLNHWENPERLRSFREFDQYWRGAQRSAKRLGYRLEEFIWPKDCGSDEAGERLMERGVQGLLIPPHAPEANWDGFDWSRFSLLRFGMSVRSIDSNLVTADHQRAMVMAISKICSYGYRRVGLVYNQMHDRSMGGNYYGGYLWAHKLLGIASPIPPLDSEINTAELAASSKDKLEKWMNCHRPDAILTLVPETVVFLRELGVRIPEDVAVAGASPYDIPVDAGIDQCPKAIGQIAAEMLIKQITLNERGEPPDPCRILVESRWRDGRSLPVRN